MVTSEIDTKFKIVRIKCGAVSLHVASIGMGEPVVFLHGFPEHWQAFGPMMSALQTEFRCIAPDQRGYGFSDRPTDVAQYGIDALADDIAGLIGALGHQRAHLVAHDWGGLVAWHFASRHRALLDRLIVFNAPHPYCLQQALARDPNQRAASTYAKRFAQADAHLAFEAANPHDLWAQFFGHDEQSGRFTPAQKAAQLLAWSQKGAWEATLNWYGAAGFDYTGALPMPNGPTPLVHAPTLLVWGQSDPLFTNTVLEDLLSIAPKCQIHKVAGGGHAVFREALADSVALVRNFLTQPI